MSLLAYISSVTSNDRNNGARTLNGLAQLTFIAAFALAIFLAIRDMSSLEGTAPKVWLFLFAVFCPELYVIVHGLSSATLGRPFFADSPVDMPFFSGAHDSSAANSAASASSSSVSALASEIKKAVGEGAQKLHSRADKTLAGVRSGAESALSSLRSSADDL
jgi:hypothetical protein